MLNKITDRVADVRSSTSGDPRVTRVRTRDCLSGSESISDNTLVVLRLPYTVNIRVMTYSLIAMMNGNIKTVILLTVLVIFLQHCDDANAVSGHSRTIVGVEESTNGETVLLLFDPGRNAAFMRKFLNDRPQYNLMNCVKFGLNRFKTQQYQIVAVDGIMSEAEAEVSISRFRADDVNCYVVDILL